MIVLYHEVSGMVVARLEVDDELHLSMLKMVSLFMLGVWVFTCFLLDDDFAIADVQRESCHLTDCIEGGLDGAVTVNLAGKVFLLGV